MWSSDIGRQHNTFIHSHENEKRIKTKQNKQKLQSENKHLNDVQGDDNKLTRRDKRHNIVMTQSTPWK